MKKGYFWAAFLIIAIFANMTGTERRHDTHSYRNLTSVTTGAPIDFDTFAPKEAKPIVEYQGFNTSTPFAAVKQSDSSIPLVQTPPQRKTNLSARHMELLDNEANASSVASLAKLKAVFDSEVAPQGAESIIAIELQQALNRLALSPSFDIVSINCRAGLCQIQALAYTDSPAEDWSKILDALRNDPISLKFIDDKSLMSDENGISAALTYFRIDTSAAVP